MKVKDLLKTKGKEVVSMEVDGTVDDAIRSMSARNIGALIVTLNEKPVGIFTERDVIKCYVSSGGKSFKELLLQDTMSTGLVVAEMEEDISKVSSTMVRLGIRHLPVMEKGRISGILAMRDVIQSQIGDLSAEIHYLKDYVINNS